MPNNKLPSNIEKRTLEVVEKKAPIPVAIQAVSLDLHIGWATARDILRRLVLQRKLQAIETGNGTLFVLPGKLTEAVTA